MTHRRIRSRRILATLALAGAGASVAAPAHAADTAPPTITITVPESPGTGTWAGWYAAPVEVRVSATDDTVVSALRYQMTGAQNESGFPPPPEFTRTVTQQGTTTLTVRASDPLGNHAERTYGIGLDLTDPTVSFAGDATNGSIRRGQIRRLTYTCADQPTAIVSCTGRTDGRPFASGDAVPTPTNGTRTITVTAVDAVGRKVDKTFGYSVIDPSLEVISPPGIVGDPSRVVVGQTLTARPAEFNPAATEVTYHWFSHTGDELHVGPTFVVPPDQFTYGILVRARGTRDGYVPTETDSQGAPRVFGESHVSGRPTISSTPVEGATLRVSAPKVAPAPETTKTVWTIGSRRAEAAELTLTAADVGQPIGCEQAYHREDYLDAHAPCVFPGGATTATVTGHAWTVHTSAALKGKPKIGKRLRAVLPTLSGPATSYAYQWLRNGKPIKGATHASYKLRKADARRKVAVRVTAITAHRPDTVSVSTPRKVRR